MNKMKTKAYIRALAMEALARMALGDTGHYGFEVIDGVCSWGIVVAPEFMNSSDDDVTMWAHIAEDFYSDKDKERIGDISEYVRFNFFSLHIGTQWEFEGDTLGAGEGYFDPKGMELDSFINSMWEDYKACYKEFKSRNKS